MRKIHYSSYSNNLEELCVIIPVGNIMKKWTFNLYQPNSPSAAAIKDFPKPPGFDETFDNDADDESSIITAEAQQAAKQRQVMATAYAPGKNLLSTAFMLWMSGNSIQLFSIMAVGMALMNPIKAIAATGETFRSFEGVDTKIPKLIFVAFQILSLGVALYKLQSMGLLPATSADWTSFIPDKNIIQKSGIPV